MTLYLGINALNYLKKFLIYINLAFTIGDKFNKRYCCWAIGFFKSEGMTKYLMMNESMMGGIGFFCLMILIALILFIAALCK